MIIDRFFDPSAKNMPQQVQINKDDIAELVKELKDIYRTSVNLTPTSTGVDKVDTDIPADVEKGFLIDPNGLFFKIEAITFDRVFLTYYANLRGEKGEQGEPGVDGEDGQDGAAATISVGTTTTGAPGTNASVQNVGTPNAAVFNFTIPRGEKGEQGEPGVDGEDGQDGAAATISVGTTTTGAPGTNASVQNVGTPNAAVFNFTIPKGEKGDKGEQGEPGTGAGNSNVYFNNVLQNDVYFDSDPQQQLDDLNQDITDEAAARQQADNTLQGNITAEAQARSNADSTLQGNIDAEAQARAGADSGLQQQITANATAIAGKASPSDIKDGLLEFYNDGAKLFEFSANQQGGTQFYGNFATKTLGNVTYPANTPGSTTTGSGDRVIETYISSDGLTWYRKWASGWKECGGIYAHSSASVNANVTISYPITFSNIPITVATQNRTNTSTDTNYYGWITTRSYSYFKWFTWWNSDASTRCSWYACGY